MATIQNTLAWRQPLLHENNHSCFCHKKYKSMLEFQCRIVGIAHNFTNSSWIYVYNAEILANIYSLKHIGWMSILIHTDYQIKSVFWKLCETVISSFHDSALLHLPFSREQCAHTQTMHTETSLQQLTSTEFSYFLLLWCLNVQIHTK